MTDRRVPGAFGSGSRGVDERGAVTVRRDGDVLGQVSSRGTGLFCLTVSAGAATYRVTVVAADWAAEAESP